MKISFLGAADTVTGSCYLVETKNKKFLVDCGMFQGSQDLDERNRVSFEFKPSEIDFVLLTHAHIDHSGNLPKLVKDGFKGKIYATAATADLCSIMLPDSAHIQEEDTDWLNRKRKRAGKKPVEAIYTKKDADETIKKFQPVPYYQKIPLADDLSVTFYDAGHILGSSFLLISSEGKNIVFSGDLGNVDQRIVRNPDKLPSTDFLIMESTYGDRLHRSRQETMVEFRSIIEETLKTSGNIVIPSFAVERTQEILYELHEMIEQGYKINLPVFIDSPLAISATEIFKKHPECFDEDMWQKIASNQDPFDFENLHFTQKTEESKRINLFDKAIIISASGMCDAGRIKHHLKHNLWKESAHIVFVGYQAKGSLGRKIIEGAETVKIMNEEIAVKAHIHTLGGFSAHADQKELMSWVGSIEKAPKKIFVLHGEEETRKFLSDKINQDLKFETYLPKWKETIEI